MHPEDAQRLTLCQMSPLLTFLSSLCLVLVLPRKALGSLHRKEQKILSQQYLVLTVYTCSSCFEASLVNVSEYFKIT